MVFEWAQMALEFSSRFRSIVENPDPALSVEASSDKIEAAALFAFVVSCHIVCGPPLPRGWCALGGAVDLSY